MEEGRLRLELAKMLDELCMLGTGIMKGVFTVVDKVPEWQLDVVLGRHVPSNKNKYRPLAKHRSCWNIYPSPAETREDLEYVVERHKMTSAQLRRLKREPYFDKKAIDQLLTYHNPSANTETFESVIYDSTTNVNSEKYEVLEYWGYPPRS